MMSNSIGYRTLVKLIEEKGSKFYDFPLGGCLRMRLKDIQQFRNNRNHRNNNLIVEFYLCVANDYFHKWVKQAETDLHEYISIDIDRFKEDSIVLFGKISKIEFEQLIKLLSSLPAFPESQYKVANLIPVLEMEWFGEEVARKEKIAAARRARYAAKRAAQRKEK